MSRYDNFGPLDTNIVTDGDTGFSKVNARLRPDQLGPGTLAYSQNGRMDLNGEWQTRKGINNFGGTIGSTNEALTVPFYLYAPEEITSAERVDDVVTVKLAPIGNNVLETVTNGVHVVSREFQIAKTATHTLSCYVKGNSRTFVRFGSSANIQAGSPTILPTAEFQLSGSGTVTLGTGVISSVGNGWYRISVSNSLVYYPSAPAIVPIVLAILSDSGTISYAGNTSNGVNCSDFQLEYASSPSRYEPTTSSAGAVNLLTYSNDLSNGVWTKTNVTIGSAVEGPGRFVDDTIVGIEGLTGTVNANGNRRITVVSGGEFTFEIPGATGSETYALSSALAGAPYLENNQNNVYGSCLFSDPSDENAEYILEATYNSVRAVKLSDGSTQTIDYPVGTNITGSVDMLQAFNHVFIFRDGQVALQWDGDFTNDFVEVENGDYTQPVYFNASSNTDIVDGVATVTETSHGLKVGQTIYVIAKDTSELTEGRGYTIFEVPDANTFKFYAQVPDVTNASVQYTLRLSIGLGFTHMPAPPWAVFHQRRLWMPFKWTMSGSSGTPTITARNISDELIASDILDHNTYDQIENQFRIASGGADYLVAAHPFADDNLLVFNRNTIHIITGVSGELEDCAVKEITREVGCLARKSVVQIGNQVLFLSDNGVYSVEFGDLYNLRGASVPLSDAIAPIIKRINSAYAHNSVAVFHDNRYWIAVPLDGSTRNNYLLVYNNLNQGWESVDFIDSENWDISNLIVAGAGGVNKLYAINRFGGIHIIDDREDDQDYLALYPGIDPGPHPIQSYATTREYVCGTAERKKFNSFALHAESSATNASDATISIETEDMDAEAELGTLSGYLGGVLPASEDAEVRGRIGNIRSYGLQVTFTPTQGRPRLRMVKINAIPGFRATTQAS